MLEQPESFMILIVDDCTANVKTLAGFLELYDYDVSIARDGEAGIERAKLIQPDLILLDVMMPGIDGLETCRRLKANKRTKNIPVIFMTVLAEIEEKVKGFEAGGVDYVTKPIQHSELIARVKTHITLYRLQNDLEQRIERRTAALAKAHAQLQAEMTQRTIVLENQLEERKRAQEEREALLNAVQEQANRVVNIMNTVPAGIILMDSERRVVTANPIAGEELFAIAGVGVGGTITRMGDRPIGQFLKPSMAGVFQDVIVEDDFSDRYFSVVARPIVAEQHPEDWVIAFRDVTIERSLQEKAAAQQSLASIGQFSAGIAHDFNNILAVILLNTEFIQRKIQSDVVLHRSLEQISRQVHNASQLIQQITDYSRQAVLERRAIDLLAVVREQSKLLSQLLSSIYTLTITLGRIDGFSVYGDATQIQQVLMNLVTNARDAMPNGGEILVGMSLVHSTETEKPLEALPPGEWIKLFVQDAGTGIPDNILPRIFDPFVTTKPIGKGTGLGLAQVQGIVTQHDGYIDVKTKAGQGTTFAIYFPKYNGPAVERASAQSNLANIVPGNGETILVAEDNPHLLGALVESLTNINYTVLSAADGKQGLDIWQQRNHEIDIILTDVVMPNMDGIELFHALENAKAKQPCIFMTGTGHLLGEEAEIEFKTLREEGMVSWVRKPIHFAELTNVIAAALRNQL
ncbi:MAG: response regulator [Caldilineaceae bacterium]|nr:response regulator [Caldilineaceae bacterium]